MYINWISSASFVSLNKRGVKNVFQLHYWQYKIDAALDYNVFWFFSLVESAILKNR